MFYNYVCIDLDIPLLKFNDYCGDEGRICSPFVCVRVVTQVFIYDCTLIITYLSRVVFFILNESNVRVYVTLYLICALHFVFGRTVACVCMLLAMCGDGRIVRV